MAPVTLSPKFQVVIPRAIREALGWRPGQKLQAIIDGDTVRLVPLIPMAATRGIAPGIDPRVNRDGDRD